MNKYTKIITGHVSQNFELKDGKFVCTDQVFIASDDVVYENNMGEVLDLIEIEDAVNKEDYFNMNMVQPKPIKIKLAVSGGLVDVTELPPNVAVEIRDYDIDDFDDEDELKEDDEGDRYRPIFFENEKI